MEDVLLIFSSSIYCTSLHQLCNKRELLKKTLLNGLSGNRNQPEIELGNSRGIGEEILQGIQGKELSLSIQESVDDSFHFTGSTIHYYNLEFKLRIQSSEAHSLVI